jgi:hypothetical protein
MPFSLFFLSVFASNIDSHSGKFVFLMMGDVFEYRNYGLLDSNMNLLPTRLIFPTPDDINLSYSAFVKYDDVTERYQETIRAVDAVPSLFSFLFPLLLTPLPLPPHETSSFGFLSSLSSYFR